MVMITTGSIRLNNRRLIFFDEVAGAMFLNMKMKVGQRKSEQSLNVMKRQEYVTNLLQSLLPWASNNPDGWKV